MLSSPLLSRLATVLLFRPLPAGVFALFRSLPGVFRAGTGGAANQGEAKHKNHHNPHGFSPAQRVEFIIG